MKEKAQVNNLKNGKKNIVTKIRDLTDYHEQLYLNNSENMGETKEIKFLKLMQEKYNILFILCYYSWNTISI